MSRIAFISVLVLVVSACGSGSGTEPTSPPDDDVAPTTQPSTTTEPSPTTTTTPPSTSTGDLQVVVPPGEGGAYPDDLMVSCGHGAFPIGALEDIRPLAEADPGGVTEAIEPFLASEEGDFWPQDGWQILHETDSEVRLVAETDSGLAFMSVTNDGSGWEWSGSSMAGDECNLEFVVPENLNTVEWQLDSDADALTPESTEIPVILNERECVGGQQIGERLVGPQIVMTDRQVFLAFAAERPEGDAFECPSNPDMAYTVELPEPMGDRELMEGLEIGISLEDFLD